MVFTLHVTAMAMVTSFLLLLPLQYEQTLQLVHTAMVTAFFVSLLLPSRMG